MKRRDEKAMGREEGGVGGRGAKGNIGEVLPGLVVSPSLVASLQRLLVPAFGRFSR
ncbi:MAG: hypothetical protein HY320_11040 [Armatimonadetes bacterium]|nr:hypothetical protein [Armatimonadota bacterium]